MYASKEQAEGWVREYMKERHPDYDCRIYEGYEYYQRQSFEAIFILEECFGGRLVYFLHFSQLPTDEMPVIKFPIVDSKEDLYAILKILDR